jgi:hypothetical protein
MSVCVISQPRFFPGLHYLHRMMVADVFVILDTVQFNPRHEENRTKLMTPNGPNWLSVPMCKVSREQLIQDTRVDGSQPWQKKALGTLQGFYGKAPCFKTYAAEIISILEHPHETLTALNMASWQPALRLLGITCTFIRASELPVVGKGPRLLLEICKHLGSEVYLSGGFGREYLDAAEFSREGVEVRFHDYAYPVYPQRFGVFVPFLSYLDMLFNVGLDKDQVAVGGKVCRQLQDGAGSNLEFAARPR